MRSRHEIPQILQQAHVARTPFKPYTLFIPEYSQIMNDRSSSEKNKSPSHLSTSLSYGDQSFALVESLAALVLSRQWTITTAESCTGGMLAAAFTEIPGSSAWFEQGVVTYSNRVKGSLLDVPDSVFSNHGAVSEACVSAMATGALRRSGANIAVSVSGIAGPDGATVGKPVGTVWICWALKEADRHVQPTDGSTAVHAGGHTGCVVEATCYQFQGDRREVRERAVLSALHGTISRLT